jgi:creatinine amidohydrolase
MAVGACDQYGPHLPIGAATCLAEALAADLSRECGVLQAPTLPYGINVPTAKGFAGAATLRPKTLHRLLNELLSAWEAEGVEEFILITAQTYEPHVEAMASVAVDDSRVRVVDALGIDLSAFLGAAPGAQHGGEVLTSLLLYLCPERVRMDAAEDMVYTPKPSVLGDATCISRIPEGSSGAVGRPSLARADAGEQMYRHIREKIRDNVFLARRPSSARR